jgi:hypothetical protein
MATITKLFSNGLLQSAVELDEITYNSVKISPAGIYSAGFDETTLTGAAERRTSDGKYLVSGFFDEYSLSNIVAVVATTYAVTNAGASAYNIDGASNPTLNLVKGSTYYFNVSASGHPFWIKTTQVTGTGSAYSSGVSNNGTQSGTITFIVPFDAPSTLYYICQYHGGMVGTINIA